MKSLALLVFVIVVIGYLAYERDQEARRRVMPAPAAQSFASPSAVSRDRPAFVCDGRTKCAQMTSCDEATFFLKNCPNTTMGGDGDGVPCERQWCRK
jgi:hypothetical protein